MGQELTIQKHRIHWKQDTNGSRINNTENKTRMSHRIHWKQDTNGSRINNTLETRHEWVRNNAEYIGNKTRMGQELTIQKHRIHWKQDTNGSRINNTETQNTLETRHEWVKN